MAETLRELVVALSLDSSNFSRNMRTITQQIKEAESTFRLAGAGVQNYEKTIAGTEARLDGFPGSTVRSQVNKAAGLQSGSYVPDCRPFFITDSSASASDTHSVDAFLLLQSVLPGITLDSFRTSAPYRQTARLSGQKHSHRQR